MNRLWSPALAGFRRPTPHSRRGPEGPLRRHSPPGPVCQNLGESTVTRNSRPPQGLAPAEGSRPPQGLAPLCKGSWQGRQALTEGLWISYRNGLTVTDNLLLHQTYNPSASHSLSTSPYTGEARGWDKIFCSASSEHANGGSGGHFAFGTKAPRRPFCPLSAGGKWTNAPQQRAAGAPRPQAQCVSPANKAHLPHKAALIERA